MTLLRKYKYPDPMFCKIYQTYEDKVSWMPCPYCIPAYQLQENDYYKYKDTSLKLDPGECYCAHYEHAIPPEEFRLDECFIETKLEHIVAELNFNERQGAMRGGIK